MNRKPWTEPYTRRELVSIRSALLRYDVRQYFREGIWQRVAWMLPRGLAYWTFIRVFGHAWTEAGNKTPDELTYEEVARAWTERRTSGAHPGQSLIEIGAFICLVLVGVGILIYLTR